MGRVIDYFERAKADEFERHDVLCELEKSGGSVPEARLAIWIGKIRCKRLFDKYGDDIKSMFEAIRDGRE